MDWSWMSLHVKCIHWIFAWICWTVVDCSGDNVCTNESLSSLTGICHNRLKTKGDSALEI